MATDVSIIIRTYNEEKFIFELLDRISHQELEQKFEVVVVDSGSTDRTVEIAKQFGFVKVIQMLKSEFTFGRSLNLGCHSALGNILVSISGHCIPSSNSWLRNLIKPFSESNVGYVYGRQVGIDEKRPDHPSTRFSERRIFMSQYPEQNFSRITKPFMNNANSAFLKKLWLIYPFDERLTGFEDLDFALFHSKRGIDGSYTGDAEVIHLHDENNARVFNRFFREQLALKKIDQQLFKRGTISVFFGFFRETLIDLASAVKSNGGIRRFYISIVGYRLAQYYAIYLAQRVQQDPLDSLGSTYESFLKWITKGRYSFENIRANYDYLTSEARRQ